MDYFTKHTTCGHLEHRLKMWVWSITLFWSKVKVFRLLTREVANKHGGDS